MKVKPGLVVFITGGGSGLGLATFKRLYSQGASVCVADLHKDRLDEIAADLPESAERFLGVRCDVSNESDVAAAIQATVVKFGKIDVAVACAGVVALTPTLTSRGPADMNLFA